jgi:hypothetical protein
MGSLNQEEKHMITIQGLDYFISGLASIFVTIFLFAQSDLRTTILFQLWMFISLLVFYILSGWSLQKFSSGLHMKVAVACAAVFYFLLFLLKGQTITYLIPLAVFNGFGAGIYWAALNFNQYIFSNKSKREQYFGYTSAVVNTLSAVSPFLGGLIITVVASKLSFGFSAGYATLFFIVFLLLACMLVFIGKLPGHDIPKFSYHHLFHKKHPAGWILILCQNAILGLYDVASDTVLGILFYLILKQEFLIGLVQAVGFTLGAIGGFVSAKLLEKQHQYFWLGAVGLAFSLSIFAIMQNITGLLIFVTISGFTGPFLKTWMSSVWFQAMDGVQDHWKNKFHLLLERDIILEGTRIISLLFLYLLLAYGDQVALARYWLAVLPILPITIGIFLQLSGKKIIIHKRI